MHCATAHLGVTLIKSHHLAAPKSRSTKAGYLIPNKKEARPKEFIWTSDLYET